MASEVDYALSIPQPWAHLIVTGQVNCIPGLQVKPPKESVGQRLAIIADGVDINLTQYLANQFPHFEFPTTEQWQQGVFGIWRKQMNEPIGRMRTVKKNEYQEVTEFVPNPNYFLGTLERIQFQKGRVGSAILAGWAMWDGGATPSSRYKAPEIKSAMKLHKCAHGPLTWVFQKPGKTKLQGGQPIKPMEAHGGV